MTSVEGSGALSLICVCCGGRKLSPFQPLIKNFKNIILNLGLTPIFKLVLSDIGQVSAYLLVWETAGLSDLG